MLSVEIIGGAKSAFGRLLWWLLWCLKREATVACVGAMAMVHSIIHSVRTVLCSSHNSWPDDRTMEKRHEVSVFMKLIVGKDMTMARETKLGDQASRTWIRADGMGHTEGNTQVSGLHHGNSGAIL